MEASHFILGQVKTMNVVETFPDFLSKKIKSEYELAIKIKEDQEKEDNQNGRI